MERVTPARLTCCRTSKLSTSLSVAIEKTFNGYELLLLRRLQTDPTANSEWREKIKKKILDENYSLGEIPHHLWYLAVTLDRKKERFLKFVKENDLRTGDQLFPIQRDTLLMKYLNCHMLTELQLDGIFKYGDDNTLPVEIFLCKSVKILSLKYNYLDKIPPDIGRMCNLECLALTNNKLQNKSLPHTLTFCTRLKTIFLDNNLLDALPGFLHQMTSLESVHRHGNHNYFKSTFMWYHTDVNERILPVFGTSDFPPRQPEQLQFWAARSVISSQRNFFIDNSVAPAMKDYIAEVFTQFYICGNCGRANVVSMPGYKVITFKNPYLGNTCVPFQHMACSIACAREIEIPSRREQINAARRLDREYEQYVNDCHKHYSKSLKTVRLQRGGTLMNSMRRGRRSMFAETDVSSNVDSEDAESSDAAAAIRASMSHGHNFTSHRRRRHSKCVVS